MKKETKKYTLFSNGTEFMVWQTENCEKCVKAVWYNEKTNTFPAYRCTIQRDIELACVTDGCGIKRVYDAVQKPICPYRQTERKPKKKKEDKNQMKLF